jgi:hypothetical protein
VYDPSKDQWSADAPLPTPLDSFSVLNLGCEVLVFGGESFGNPVKTLWLGKLGCGCVAAKVPSQPSTSPSQPKQAAQTTAPAAPAGASSLLTVSGLQSRPEPFTKSTILYFQLSQPAEVTLKVYQGGHYLRTLRTGARTQGWNKVYFDGLDDEGKPLAPGAYGYLLVATHGGASFQSYSHLSRIPETQAKP